MRAPLSPPPTLLDSSPPPLAGWASRKLARRRGGGLEWAPNSPRCPMAGPPRRGPKATVTGGEPPLPYPSCHALCIRWRPYATGIVERPIPPRRLMDLAISQSSHEPNSLG